jgi:hypothetical protein
LSHEQRADVVDDQARRRKELAIDHYGALDTE